MLYGNRTKIVRHVDEDDITLEPQRFYMHTFWKTDNAGSTSRTDGLDLQDEKTAPVGSKVTKHKLEIRVTPETIEPQQLYMARVKLSFHDVYMTPVCGGTFTQASYGDTATENFVATSANPVSLHLFPSASGAKIDGDETANQEIGGSSSGYGISEAMLDDYFKHVCRPKKVTVFDQRPLIGERWQRVPSKVKTFNDKTYYGLFLFNDSPRGATPADTQVKINIKSYWEEKAL
jgi:hypothetical protein